MTTPARQGWLEHPRIDAHYRWRTLVDHADWESVIPTLLGRPAARSLELGCQDGGRSFSLFERGSALAIDGIAASEDAVIVAEAGRERCRAPGIFRHADLNVVSWPRASYDLIFAVQALHMVVDVRGLLDRVHDALTPNGLFVFEGYAGPSRFQWTDKQLDLTSALMACLPERLRTYAWGTLKLAEGRADPVHVAQASPFAAIRSGEILSSIRDRFDVRIERRLGGTLQHLIYNGIVHNFDEADAEANAWIDRLARIEDILVDTQAIESDFWLMIGRRR